MRGFFSRSLILVVGLAGGAANAQILFADDVETGTLLITDTPAGNWDAFWYPEAMNSVSAEPSAAHRGGFGMRVVDTVGSGPAGGENTLIHVVPNATGDYHVRAWFRVAVSNDAGSFSLIQTAQTVPMLDVIVANPGLVASTGGFNNNGMYAMSAGSAPLAVGTWYLVEASAFGIGSSNGYSQLRIDGDLVAEIVAQDWTGLAVTDVSVGEPWSNTRAFLGTLEFDDVRMGPAPHAAALGVSVGSELVRGACSPVRVELLASGDASVAAAPYDVDVTLSATGVPAELFVDPLCTAPGAMPRIFTGQTGVSASVRALDAGTLTFRAEHLDFLPGDAPVLVVVSDAGTPAVDAGVDAGFADGGSGDEGDEGDAGVAGGDGGVGAGPEFGVGCGCGATNAAPVLFAVLLVLVRARRPRRNSSE